MTDQERWAELCGEFVSRDVLLAQIREKDERIAVLEAFVRAFDKFRRCNNVGMGNSHHWGQLESSRERWKMLPTKSGLFVEHRPASEEPIAVGFYGHAHMLTLEQARQLSTQLIEAIRSAELRSIQSQLEQDGKVGM